MDLFRSFVEMSNCERIHLHMHAHTYTWRSMHAHIYMHTRLHFVMAFVVIRFIRTWHLKYEGKTQANQMLWVWQRRWPSICMNAEQQLITACERACVFPWFRKDFFSLQIKISWDKVLMRKMIGKCLSKFRRYIMRSNQSFYSFNNFVVFFKNRQKTKLYAERTKWWSRIRDVGAQQQNIQ